MTVRDLPVDLPITSITIDFDGCNLTIARGHDALAWWRSVCDQLGVTDRCVVAVTCEPSVISQTVASQTVANADARRTLIERYQRRHACNLKEIAARANVSPRALRAWRAGALPDKSVKSMRIEALLTRDVRSG
jgi:hypothetical protein